MEEKNKKGVKKMIKLKDSGCEVTTQVQARNEEEWGESRVTTRGNRRIKRGKKEEKGSEGVSLLRVASAC